MNFDYSGFKMFKVQEIKALPSFSETRYDTCKTCEHFNNSIKTCKKCGCFMPAKTKLRGASCPVGKW